MYKKFLPGLYFLNYRIKTIFSDTVFVHYCLFLRPKLFPKQNALKYVNTTILSILNLKKDLMYFKVKFHQAEYSTGRQFD